jgi:hypothetical protein
MSTQESLMAALGGPDTVQVFSHDVASLPEIRYIKRHLPAYERYTERALLLAREHDIVLTREPVDADYREFLRRLGLGPGPGRVVSSVDKAAGLIGDSFRVVLNPYIVTGRELRLRAALQARLGRAVALFGGRSDIVRHANRKDRVYAKARRLGVPVAPGEVVRLATPGHLAPVRRAIEKYRRVTGSALVCAREGSAGSSHAVVDHDGRDVALMLRRLPAGVAYLVQVPQPVTVSPNLQLVVPPERGPMPCVSASDQRLHDRIVYQGNLFPSVARTLPAMLESARRLGRWLQSEGYAGLVGFDFCEYTDPRTGETCHFLAEINPRVNGATYPRALMERLGARACATTSLPTTARSFAELRDRLGARLYSPAARHGAVPYNAGCLTAGCCWFALLGDTRAEVEGLLAALGRSV